MPGEKLHVFLPAPSRRERTRAVDGTMNVNLAPFLQSIRRGNLFHNYLPPVTTPPVACLSLRNASRYDKSPPRVSAVSRNGRNGNGPPPRPVLFARLSNGRRCELYPRFNEFSWKYQLQFTEVFFPCRSSLATPWSSP